MLCKFGASDVLLYISQTSRNLTSSLSFCLEPGTFVTLHPVAILIHLAVDKVGCIDDVTCFWLQVEGVMWVSP